MSSSNSFEKNRSAIAELSKVIFGNSLFCAEELKDGLNCLREKDKQERWMYVLFEFIYFFMHMLDRAVYGEVGDDERKRLLDELGLAVVNPTVETIFGDWPQSLKEGIRSEFYQHLNDAELEYSSCKELLTKDNPFSDKALFSKLAKNVAELAGRPNNPETIMQVIELAIGCWKKMHLEELVKAALSEL
jgi:hypothetical protein